MFFLFRQSSTLAGWHRRMPPPTLSTGQHTVHSTLPDYYTARLHAKPLPASALAAVRTGSGPSSAAPATSPVRLTFVYAYKLPISALSYMLLFGFSLSLF